MNHKANSLILFSSWFDHISIWMLFFLFYAQDFAILVIKATKRKHYKVCFSDPPPPQPHHHHLAVKWMGSCIHTWGWHSHNGNTPGAGGLLPPGTLATDAQQMAQIGPQRRAQLRNPNKCLCLCLCVCAHAIWNTTYNRYWIIDWDPLLCLRARSHLVRLLWVCVGLDECSCLVDARRCFQVLSWFSAKTRYEWDVELYN